jgi:hypothetical protein
LPRTSSSRIRVYLLCEFALQRKVRPFFCFKTQIYTKEVTLPLGIVSVAEIRTDIAMRSGYWPINEREATTRLQITAALRPRGL